MEPFSLYNPVWTKGEFRPLILAYYYKQWIDYNMGFHAHQMVEIMYVISGKCTVETEQQPIAMRKGDLIMLDGGVRHRLIVEKESPCRMLNVEFTFVECEGLHPSLKQLAQGCTELQRLLGRQTPYVLLRDPSDIYYTLKSLVMELDSGGSGGGGGGNAGMIHLLISELLIRVARLDADETKDSAGRQADRYVRKAAEYIHQHYDCDIQTKDVAAAVNLHPVYLQRIFKAGMDVTMTEYLARLRIDKAKMLLARADVPIIDIADYVGLNSRQYFSALFKKMTGLSPAAYRKSAVTIQHYGIQDSIR